VYIIILEQHLHMHKDGITINTVSYGISLVALGSMSGGRTCGILTQWSIILA
jgi:hypothetical protein